MDSPEPGSPASSSDSPGLEELTLPPLQESNYSYSNARNEPYSSGGKRRLPMSNVGSSSKTRRREETSNRRPTATTNAWQPTEYPSTTRSSKDEMIDHHVVEKTRQEEQADFFLENGYVVIKQAFSKEKAAEWTKNIWVRLGFDPNDKSTWTRERIHMPWHKREKVSTFAPKAWMAMEDLLGEGRIDDESSAWGDSFIVNLGTPELESATEDLHPRSFDNWHVDGDFFVHYLDSPEQALLVIPLFSDIRARGGGTYVCPDGIDRVARYLAAHPEGVLPFPGKLAPSTTRCAHPPDDPASWTHRDAAQAPAATFAELTGEVGDVVLLHPLMLHSASKNYLREARVITNPPVSLRTPFDFDRADPDAFSLVERKTLRALGVARLPFSPTTERRRLVPQTRAAKDAMLEEKGRLAAYERAQASAFAAAAA
ncbi:hypothetical protein PHLGIDRAFT_116178 [Phlebiopsis gigantea 11061_1 CR5-6]|uniref:Phytanoyl-CoA dioxygenase n=1 Tax=Phlebiopsis gigantea (strain 11061_1 CR5-6) TaxID=745531 RepID=A0A0C3NWD0_PHLG1|nr:hypothetical protein PHLGIDRAFT_116178 [Phlebiopsis gigantea 11061_1 CR5-6]